MKISKQWLFALLACSLLGTECLVAQTDESDAIQKKVPKRDREMRPGALPYGPGFSGDFFVGLSGGFNVLESAGDKAGSAGGRFSPAFNVYVGKWFTPSVGVRVGYSGLTARGWTTRPGNFTYGEPSDGVYKKRMGFTYLHGDVLWNISNLLGGYRSDRRWEFVPFVSAGWLHTNPRDRQGGEPDEFAMGAGLLNKIYLTDWLDLTLEARQLIFKERAVNPGTGGIAGMTSVTVGLDFNISSPDFSKWHPINRVRPGYSSFGKTGAARSSNRDENGKVIRGPYKTNKFFDNTFVSVGGGANFYSSTDDKGGSWMRQIAPAIEAAFEESDAVMLEQFVDGREVSCGIMVAGGKEWVLPVTELISEKEFFDYEAKYEGACREVTPAELPAEIVGRLNRATSTAYHVLGCRGVVRVDFIIDRTTGDPYFIEVNTTPGMSAASIVPQQWRAAGLTMGQAFEMIINETLK